MKAYLINDLTITDTALFMQYVKEMDKIIERYNGKTLARPYKSNATLIEGEWEPRNIIVIEFNSKEEAENYISDPETQELFVFRRKSSTVNLILVEDFMPI